MQLSIPYDAIINTMECNYQYHVDLENVRGRVTQKLLTIEFFQNMTPPTSLTTHFFF